MARYLIIGSSGSGKSTLARRIAEIYSIPYYDTDSMYWKEGWLSVAGEDIIKQLPLDEDGWAIDGNFVNFREHLWKSADVIIWLNYPLSMVLLRQVRRNFRWWISRRLIWSGNRMTLMRILSGVRHCLRQHPSHRRSFPSFLEEYKDKKVYIFSRPGELKEWIGQHGGG